MSSIAILESWFQKTPKVLVALSGGVDSCLVAFLSRRFLGKASAPAVISVSASLKSRDLLIAREFCDKYDIYLEEISGQEVHDENYLSNPVNRCFYCKSALYTSLRGITDNGKYSGYTIINGNNLSDTGDYRPGLKAAKDYSARSPLIECEITKEEIRGLAKSFDLFVWNKPASPCLSSRFPYGERISLDKLRQVEQAEDYLIRLGYPDSRVRYYGEMARIEVASDQVEKLKTDMPAISNYFSEIGFSKCEVDEEGLVSGKLNRNVVL
ncbi:MAG: TIGR00268 family protein [Cyclobacteriaceae bacterium]|nr:MAG: TIGR00268 family protein [Cyclobacteriaceae bacterium]